MGSRRRELPANRGLRSSGKNPESEDRLAAERDRAARVAELRAAIEEGTYLPSSREVAAAILWACDRHRVAAREH